MFYLTYVSSAVKPFSIEQLVALLQTCHRNNSQLDVSGMLLYKDGNFMQLLEGDKDTVLAVHATIKGDSRHTGLLTMIQGEQAARQFPGWSMGFRDLNAPDVESIPGYSDFLNTPLTAQAFSSDPTRCQKLLLTFKRAMMGQG